MKIRKILRAWVYEHWGSIIEHSARYGIPKRKQEHELMKVGLDLIRKFKEK